MRRMLQAVFIVMPSWQVPLAQATLVTFDNLPLNTGTASTIPSGYEGLSWSNFGAINGILWPSNYPFITNGYYYGMVTASNVVFNGSGNPAEIDSRGTNFDFLSAYLTGAWTSNLNIEVQGFRSGSLIYDQTVVASATNPTPFSFNYLDVDRVYFSASGGQPAFGTPAGSTHFVMDNLTFEFIPEPSSLLLVTAGALLLWPLLKRRRA